MYYVYLKWAGKTLKNICQLSIYFANIMTNTGSFQTFDGHCKLPNTHMGQIRVRDYIFHLFGVV